MRRVRLQDNLDLRLSLNKFLSIEDYRDSAEEQVPITSKRFY